MTRSIESIADAYFGDPVRSARHGLEQIYLCPVCGKDKLSINIESGFYRCWKCADQKGNVKWLEEDDDSPIVAGARLQEYRDKLERGEIEAIQSLETAAAIPIREGTDEFDYLVDERGMTTEQIARYDLRRSPLRDYRKQVIFPIYDQGYKGFQRRLLKPWSNGIRYLNCEGFDRENTIYNLDRALDYNEIPIAEGIFSAYATGPAGICTFGKDMTRKQAARLAACGRTLVLCYDGGEYLAEIRALSMLVAFGARVDRVELPLGKDPDDVADFDAVVRDTREPVNGAWLTRQKARLTRLSIYGEIKIPPGFFDSLSRLF